MEIMPFSITDLKYGICDCEYPCSCVEFREKRYSSWQDIMKETINELDELKEMADKGLSGDIW